jgi:hypothetical protein
VPDQQSCQQGAVAEFARFRVVLGLVVDEAGGDDPPGERLVAGLDQPERLGDDVPGGG